jgi:hypothetical protein
MRIRACIRCGSTDLDFTPGESSAVFTKVGMGPMGGVALCRKCQNVSGPIEFGGEKDYKAFVAHLKRRYKKR